MDRVFFVMPLRVDKNVEAKRAVITEVVGDRAILPDTQTSHADADFDIDRARQMLQNVELVIADLSFERPSCYFELGMAQALDIPCLLIAEAGTQIHQRSGPVSFYADLTEFRHLIERAMQDIRQTLDGRKDSTHMADTGYFLVADVLGFGKIVRNLSEQELDERIDVWVDLVQTTAECCGVENLQLISDTIFASTPKSEEGLKSLISFSRKLLIDGIEKSLAVRGGIVHGTFTWGNLTYGRAVVAGYKLEQAQNWIGVACAPDLPDIGNQWSLDSLVCYPPPLKRAKMQLHPVVAWTVPETERLQTLLMGGGLTKSGDIVTWELGEKMNNTILFRLYLDLLAQTRQEPDKYYGKLPADPIESVLGQLLKPKAV